MKQLWKRNAVVGTILVFVCAAIFLNGKYAEKVDKPTKVLGQSEFVSTDGDTASEAAKSIETLASYTLSEAQIENMVTAKGYEDCVVFMSEDGVSVVVSTGEEGLQTEDIARITDIVKQETGLNAESIKIMEVN